MPARISETTKAKIKGKSVMSLPSNPSEKGLNINSIKKAMYTPVEMVIDEINRIVDEQQEVNVVGVPLSDPIYDGEGFPDKNQPIWLDDIEEEQGQPISSDSNIVNTLAANNSNTSTTQASNVNNILSEGANENQLVSIDGNVNTLTSNYGVNTLTSE